MQVFSVYFKVMKKNFKIFMIYVVVFVLITVIISNAILGQTEPAAFFETKYSIALFNEDGEAPLAQALAAYIEDNGEIVDIGREKQDIQDALYYGAADCVISIPQGFSEGFMQGEPVRVNNTAAEGKPASISVDFLVNRYLSIAALYAKAMPEASQADIVAYVAQDLANTATVEYKTSAAPPVSADITIFFRILAYSLLAAIMMGVSPVMLSFNETNIYNRTLCAPLKPASKNLQMVLANLGFALVIWAVMCGYILISTSPELSVSLVLLCVNALVFTLVSLSIGFLAGKLIKSGGVQAAVTNVVSLGMSFLCGVFVEQALLGETVQTLGSFLPAYWYVRGVDAIDNMGAVTAQSIAPVVESMLIQLGFAAAILIVTLAISKQRSKTAIQ